MKNSIALTVFGMCACILVGTGLEFLFWAGIFNDSPGLFLCWKTSLMWFFQIIYWILLMATGVIIVENDN